MVQSQKHNGGRGEMSFIIKKIKYLLKKWKLERKLKRESDKMPLDNEWYETYVEWCSHTNSSNIIYNTYVRKK